MATVRKRNGRWNAQVRKKGAKPISLTFDLKLDALAWAKKQEALIDQGKWKDRVEAEQPLGVLLDRYLTTISPSKACHEADKCFSKRIKSMLGSIPLMDVDSRYLSGFRDDLLSEGLSGQTVKHHLGLISRVFSACIKEWHIYDCNPVLLVRQPKISSGRDRVISPSEFDLIKRYLNSVMVDVMTVAYETAMRQGEIVRIQRQDVDFGESTLHIPITKNRKPRTIPLSESAIKSVRRLILTGIPSAQMIKYYFRSAVQKSEIPHAVFHDLRHTAITKFFEMGLNVMEVSAISGHTDLKMLKRYTHLSPGYLVKKIRGEGLPLS